MYISLGRTFVLTNMCVVAFHTCFNESYTNIFYNYSPYQCLIKRMIYKLHYFLFVFQCGSRQKWQQTVCIVTPSPYQLLPARQVLEFSCIYLRHVTRFINSCGINVDMFPSKNVITDFFSMGKHFQNSQTGIYDCASSIIMVPHVNITVTTC